MCLIWVEHVFIFIFWYKWRACLNWLHIFEVHRIFFFSSCFFSSEEPSVTRVISIRILLSTAKSSFHLVAHAKLCLHSKHWPRKKMQCPRRWQRGRRQQKRSLILWLRFWGELTSQKIQFPKFPCSRIWQGLSRSWWELSIFALDFGHRFKLVLHHHCVCNGGGWTAVADHRSEGVKVGPNPDLIQWTQWPGDLVQ
jgi:hypothetical protein